MNEPVPPLWLAILMSAILGLIAQYGSTKAFSFDKDKDKQQGFLILSLIFSGFGTLLCARLAKMDIYLSMGIGTIIGAIPAVWTIILGIGYIGKRYDLEVKELGSVQKPSDKTEIREDDNVRS